MTLTIEVAKASLDGELLPELRALFEGEEAQPELRLDLPGEWAIFWKRRDSENRLLVAHPEHEQWVVTAALEADFGRKLVARLETMAPGTQLDFRELGRLSPVGNLDWIIQIA